MDICKHFSEIKPEQSYSVSDAARFLRIQFRGDDLIAYKTAGLPKKGRKRR